MSIEFVVSLFAQMAAVAYVNAKSYYFLKNRFVYTAWLGPFFLAVIYSGFIVSAIREGTEGSWTKLITILVHCLFVLSSLAAIAAGFLDRRK